MHKDVKNQSHFLINQQEKHKKGETIYKAHCEWWLKSVKCCICNTHDKILIYGWLEKKQTKKKKTDYYELFHTRLLLLLFNIK